MEMNQTLQFNETFQKSQFDFKTPKQILRTLENQTSMYFHDSHMNMSNVLSREKSLDMSLFERQASASILIRSPKMNNSVHKYDRN
jgi:hypothetical protein